MAKGGRGTSKEVKQIHKKKELSYKEKLNQKTFPKYFVATGEVLEVQVLFCAWDESLIGTIQEVIQIDDDFFMSIEHQNEKKPWLRFGFLIKNIEILNE